MHHIPHKCEMRPLNQINVEPKSNPGLTVEFN